MSETTQEQRDLVRAALDNPEYVEFSGSHIVTIEGVLNDLARAEELLKTSWYFINREYPDMADRIDTFLSGDDNNE